MNYLLSYPLLRETVFFWGTCKSMWIWQLHYSHFTCWRNIQQVQLFVHCFIPSSHTLEKEGTLRILSISAVGKDREWSVSPHHNKNSGRWRADGLITLRLNHGQEASELTCFVGHLRAGHLGERSRPPRWAARVTKVTGSKTGHFQG